MLPNYVADNDTSADLFTDALTYAYNTRVYRTIGLYTSELSLLRTPSPLALEPRAQEDTFPSIGEYQLRKKDRLARLKPVNQNAMECAQSAYKRNFDDRLCGHPQERVNPRSHVFVRMEVFHTAKDGRSSKLSPVTDGPFTVVFSDSYTVVIANGEIQERVSCKRGIQERSPSHEILPTKDASVPEFGLFNTMFSRPLVPRNHTRGLSDVLTLAGVPTPPARKPMLLRPQFCGEYPHPMIQ